MQLSGTNPVRDRWSMQLASALEARRAAHIHRSLTEIAGPQGRTLRIGTAELIQFCTNNYLGLAEAPAVVEAAHRALERYGFGAGASRLVAGSMELHHRLEEALAAFKGTEAALLFPTGFMANLATLTTFAGPDDRIVSDKLNHASLMDAARFSGAEHRIFPHRHYERAAALLERPWRAHPTPDADTVHEAQRASERRRFLVTDSVFSMDGDLADLPALGTLARQHEALLIVDEAHGTGVLGAAGRGLAELQGAEDAVSLSIGTLSKAFGSVGGFVCGPKPAIEMLLNAGRPFVYTTALPPVCSAASLAALEIIRSDEGRQRRQRVLALAARVRTELRALEFDCGASQTPIVPVIMGSAQRALEASEYLRQRGLWVPAIRPPTVGPNQSRLRISLMATHTDDDIERLISACRAWRDRL